jgi:hypothetical protein
MIDALADLLAELREIPTWEACACCGNTWSSRTGAAVADALRTYELAAAYEADRILPRSVA